jgi:phage terminase large subunit-like protein
MTDTVIAVDRSANWAHVTIAAARKSGENYETELVTSMVAPTENQVFVEIMRLLDTGKVTAVGLDEQLMPNLAKRLKERGVRLYSLWTKEVAAACAGAYAAFASGLVTHGNEPLLRAQIGNGVPKYSGDKWLMSRKDSYGEIDALMATILAMYVAHLQSNQSIQVF